MKKNVLSVIVLLSTLLSCAKEDFQEKQSVADTPYVETPSKQVLKEKFGAALSTVVSRSFDARY